MKNQKLLFLVVMILISTSIFAQIKVSGTVLDEGGTPLPGASIIELGAQNGTTTDFDGNFKFTTRSNNGKIEISYLGYKKLVMAFSSAKSVFKNIKLQPDNNVLNEVVVTALGIKKEQKKIGYATQKINTEVMENTSAPNVGNLFTGKVSGLQVSNPTGIFQSANFSLRGKSPLIVVDGIPMNTNFFDISQNDIADINVLKGTSASALYGSRGRNGAILITTKKAKTDGLIVDVNQNTMLSAGFTVFPKTQTEYGNGSNGKYEFWDGRDGGIADGDMIWGPKFSDNLNIPQWNSPIKDNVTGETIKWYGDVKGTKYDDRTRYSRVPIPWKYHNNLKDFLGTGIISRSDFALNYKNDRGAFRLSGNYNYQKGRVPNTTLYNGGLSFNSSIKLSDNLTLDGKMTYNRVYSPNYPRYGYGPKNHMYTILIWMGDDVNGKDQKKHLYVPGLKGYRQANWNYAWYNNPYFAAYELNQEYDGHRLNNLVSLKYDITDEFSIKGRASSMLWRLFEDRESPKTYLNYGDPREGDYKTWNTTDLKTDLDILASYETKLENGLDLGVNIGAATFLSKYQMEYNATDGLIVPFVYSLNNTAGGYKASTTLRKKATRSVYGTLDLGYKNMVYLNLTGRNDWSSTLPKENRSYFYPSASLSFILSEIFEIPEPLDYLKIFGSWAQVSSDLDPYQTSSVYKSSASFGSIPKLYYPNTLINSNIKPEQSTSIEVGLSSSLFKRRLNLDFTYFNTLDKNQIIKLPISDASGFSNRYVNGNEYTTNGIEFAIGATPVKNENFTWKTNINASHQVKRLTKIYDDQERFGNLRLNDRADAFYAGQWRRTPEGKLIVDAGSGMPIKDPYRRNIGHRNPDWILGLQNEFKYKDFTINIGIDGQLGGLMWSKTIQKMWWGGKHPNSTLYRDKEYAAGKPIYVPDAVNVVSGDVKWDTNGDIIEDTRTYKKNTTIVSWQSWSQNYPYRANVTYKDDKFFANIFNRSFIKLRNVTVKYNLKKLLKLNAFKQADISLSGYNLLMWKKIDIVDPDFGNDDDLQDPSTRYIGLGLNLKF